MIITAEQYDLLTPEYWTLQLGLKAVESAWKSANSGLLTLDVGNAVWASTARNATRELAGDLMPTVIKQSVDFFNTATMADIRLRPETISSLVKSSQQAAVDRMSWKVADLFEGRNGTRLDVIKAANNGARTTITSVNAGTQSEAAVLAEAKGVKPRGGRGGRDNWFDVVLSPTACRWCKLILDRQLSPRTAASWSGAHKACGCRLVPAIGF